MKWVAVLGLAALACIAGPSSTAGAAEDEGEDVAEPLPWRIDADTVFLRRVVEAASGKPVAGATVRLFAEDPLPIPGFGSPIATVSSGADGWVRIRKADLDADLLERYGKPVWAYAEAPGLGPNGEYRVEARDEDWELGPSTTRSVAIHDRLGRPVADARVGWLLGCGHMPDLRSARTGVDGVARLTGVSTDSAAQTWVDRDGFVSGYVDEGWFPWERPTVATVEWGGVVEGTILRHDGTPAARVPIGGYGFHRGPWTQTDANGNFRFVGSDAASPGHSVYAELGHQGLVDAPDPRWEIPAPPPGHRVIVRLPAPGAAAVSAAATRLVVEPRIAWPTARDHPRIRVIAVRADDGWTTTGDVGEQGVALLDVRPGDHVVYAEARREGCELVCSRARATIPVDGTRGAWMPLPMPVPAFLPIAFGPGPHDGLRVQVLTEGEVAEVDLDLEEGAESVEVYVPTDRPLWVRSSRPTRAHVVPVDVRTLRPDERAAPVAVPTFPPVTVHAAFVDDAGSPVKGWLIELEHARALDLGERATGAASATPVTTLPSGDRLTLVAWPMDPARFQPSILEVVSTPFGGAPVDLGVVRMPPRSPALRLEDGEGKPVDGWHVRVTRGDRGERLAVRAGHVLDPWISPGLLATGAWVRAKAYGNDEAVPFTRRLEGPGPWTVRAPTGSLTIEACDESGAPLADGVVHLDGRRCPILGGKAALTSVDAGPHEVIVESARRIPRRWRFTLAAGEARTWVARLRAGTSVGR